jgi:hypothetical protein
LSTGQGQFSSLRGNTVTANRFFGDGSALTGLPTSGGITTLPPALSSATLSTSEGILSSIYTGFLSTGSLTTGSMVADSLAVGVALLTASNLKIGNMTLNGDGLTFGSNAAIINVTTVRATNYEDANGISVLGPGSPSGDGSGTDTTAFPSNLSSATLSTSEGVLSSIFTGFLSTGQGQFSSLRGNTVTANRFFGDGSALTGLPTSGGITALPPALSSATLSTSEGILSSIYVGFLSTGQGQFSSLRGNTVTANRFFGDGSALTGLPTSGGMTALPPALSSATLSTSEGILSSIYVGFLSTGQGQFSSLRGNTVTANRFFGDGSALTGLPTSGGGITALPPALSSATLSTSEGILSSIYVGFLSTGQGQFSSLRGNTVTANRFFGDGSALTGLPTSGGGITTLPPALSSATLSTSEGILSSIFTGFLSTGQGQFSSLRINTVTANRFFGDGSAIINVPLLLPPALSSATLSTSEGVLSSIFTGFLSTGQGQFSSLRGNVFTANRFMFTNNSELKKYPLKPVGNTLWILMNSADATHTVSLPNRFYFIEVTETNNDEYTEFIYDKNFSDGSSSPTNLTIEQGEWFTTINHPLSFFGIKVKVPENNTLQTLATLEIGQSLTFIYYGSNWIVQSSGFITIPT